jgi:hypothetical protein
MIRRTLHWIVCLGLMLSAAGPLAPATPTVKVATLPPEVHLRRIHLVRPDLIPYPIAYEMVC